MASRFVEADEQFIEELKQRSEKKKKKHKTKYRLSDRLFSTVGENKRRKWGTWKLRSTRTAERSALAIFHRAEERKR